MEIEDYLMDELKRLNRMNDLLEKEIMKNLNNNESEQIMKNILAMCEIADRLF